MNAVGWFDVYVEDMDRAVGFYENVLGTKLVLMDDPTHEALMMSFSGDMHAYGAAGALVKTQHSKPGRGGTQVYFLVEDCPYDVIMCNPPYHYMKPVHPRDQARQNSRIKRDRGFRKFR